MSVTVNLKHTDDRLASIYCLRRSQRCSLIVRLLAVRGLISFAKLELDMCCIAPHVDCLSLIVCTFGSVLAPSSFLFLFHRRP